MIVRILAIRRELDHMGIDIARLDTALAVIGVGVILWLAFGWLL